MTEAKPDPFLEATGELAEAIAAFRDLGQRPKRGELMAPYQRLLEAFRAGERLCAGGRLESLSRDLLFDLLLDAKWLLNKRITER